MIQAVGRKSYKPSLFQTETKPFCALTYAESNNIIPFVIWSVPLNTKQQYLDGPAVICGAEV